ncbi:MAG: hypothetical protein LBK91_01615, partial [Synergistaceae bacterium]|nr:hypothetical protein [Synergistaceae bacterium]
MTATENAKPLSEAIATIADRFGLDPTVPGIKQIRAREQREAVEFLNRHYAAGGVQSLDELEPDMSMYRFAAKYYECENGCKGLDTCE